MTATTYGSRALPFADAGDWPPLVVRTATLDGPDFAAGPVDPPSIGKLVRDRRGRTGIAVELPDVYRDSAAVAQSALERELAAAVARSGGNGGIDDDRAAVGTENTGDAAIDLDLVRELLTRLVVAAPGLLHPCGAGRAALHHPDGPFVLTWRADLLSIALPRLERVRPATLSSLRSFAARLNADVRLARLDLGRDWCGFAVHLPLAPLADDDAGVAVGPRPGSTRLAAAVWMSCHALSALARNVPALPTLVDPDFQPVLQLAAAEAAVPAVARSVPVPPFSRRFS